MTNQDNESFKERVSAGVINAVLEAGRAHPADPDVNLNLPEAFEGICGAMATLAASFAQMPEDREQGAAILDSAEEQIVRQLRFFADAIRSGEFPPPERPKPRLVE